MESENQVIVTVGADLRKVVSDVVGERRRQDEKWGVQNHPNPTWLTILAEEVGEAAQDTLENDFAKNPLARAVSHITLRTELVRVAAVAIAWIQALDRKVSHE